MSGVGGPSPLPKGWRWARLGDLLSDIQPGFASSARSDDGVVQLRMNNVTTDGRFDWSSKLKVPADTEQMQRFSLEPRDIVFNNTNSAELVGKSALVTELVEPVVYSNHFTRLRCGTEAEPHFVAHWLQAAWRRKVFEHGCDRWVGQAGFQRKKLIALEVPVPPLGEQRRIADLLDAAIAQQTSARAAAAVQDVAARSIYSRFLAEVLDKAADDYGTLPLEEVATMAGGFGFPLSLQGRTSLSYPFIKVSDMAAASDNDPFVSRAANTVDDALLRELGARTYPAGTVIFPKVGGAVFTNRKRITGIESTFDNNVMGLVPKSIEPIWLFSWMQTVNLADLANTQALPSINQARMRQLSVPIPPADMRSKLLSYLAEVRTGVDALRTAASAQLTAIDALPAALLSAAFRGDL